MDRRKRPRARATLFAVAVAAALPVALAATGCARRPATADAASAAAGVDCASMRLEAEPDLIGWDAPSRSQLDRLRRQGVVAVRYEASGCDVSLELLPDCIGPKNKYVYVPRNTSDTKIAHDAKELFARMPVGASSLSGFVKAGHAVRSDAKLVGSVELPEGSSVSAIDFVGSECKRATHIIRAVWVGGFAMAHGDPQKVDGASNVFSGDRVGEAVVHEGYPQACERASAEAIELEGCAVPLKLSLISLREEASAPAAKASPGREPPKVDDVAGAGDGDGGAKRVFDQASVERVIRAHQNGVRRACWEGSTSSLRRLTVAISAHVDADGHVSQAESQVQDADGPADVASIVGRCIANDVRSWTFPEPESERSLIVPFHFIRQ